MADMFFHFSREIPSVHERNSLAGHIKNLGADDSVWDVFGCFLSQCSARTRPVMLRAERNGKLAGVAFLIECTANGSSLFRDPALARVVDLSGVKAVTWLRVGLCAETFANPGFVAEGFEPTGVISGMLEWLREKCAILFVNDALANRALHAAAHEFAYVRDGSIEMGGMTSVDEFIGGHHSLKRKTRTFTKKGGVIEVWERALVAEDLARVGYCLKSTTGSSIVASPFQELFPGLVAATCSCSSPGIVHFVARKDGGMLGYHTFVKTGRHLHMLHGAFDRSLPGDHRAYENLITAAVAYAIRHRLEAVHFGPILNETKKRMMNTTAPTALFFSSNCWLLRMLVPVFFRFTRMQSRKLLSFR